jgi:putative transposase
MNLFGKPLAQELCLHQSFDHQTWIKKGKEVLFEPIHHLLEKEFIALWEYLDRMLTQGKIVESDANMGVQIIFVPKLNGKHWLCVDYRDLNAVTIKDPYLLPLMDELRDW